MVYQARPRGFKKGGSGVYNQPGISTKNGSFEPPPEDAVGLQAYQ